MTTGVQSVSSSQSAILVGGVQSLLLDATGVIQGADSGIKPVTASIAASALTVGLNPCTLQFRSPTLANGVPVQRAIGTALALVVPATATLGTVSAVMSRLILLAIDATSVGGTVEPAIVNVAGGLNLDETTLITTTGISVGSTASNIAYSTTARTGVPFRVVGYVESTQATAGTWATAPSTVQGYGGQALNAMSSLGYGQTWVANGAGMSRAYGVTYYNTTGKPIVVYIGVPNIDATTTFGYNLALTQNGVARIFNHYGTGSIGAGNQFESGYTTVPPGATYVANGNPFSAWFELR